MAHKFFDDVVSAKLADYTTYASNYRQLREIYQAEYPGKWKDQLISDIAKERRQETPGYKDASARRQVDRYEAFITGRGTQARNPDKPVGAMKTALRDLGQRQEPIKRDAPPDGLTITIKGSQGKGRHERERTFSLTMDYAQAVEFAQDPTLEEFFYELYPDWNDAVETLFEKDDTGTLSGVSVS